MRNNNDNILDLIFSRTQGIALVRPITTDRLHGPLRRTWAKHDPHVGIVIGNACETGTDITSTGIVGSAPFMGSVDLLAITEPDAMAQVKRLLAQAEHRLTMMLQGEHPELQFNNLVAFIGKPEVLEELARQIMLNRNLSIATCEKISAYLVREGDGVVIQPFGHLTDKPILPRGGLHFATAEVAQA